MDMEYSAADREEMIELKQDSENSQHSSPLLLENAQHPPESARHPSENSRQAPESVGQSVAVGANPAISIGAQYRWGLLGVHPDCLQRLNTGAFFLFLVSTVNAISGAVTNGLLKVSISSLERRYKLTSYDSGLIISMYDIAGCLGLLPISYFGGRGHKPRWLGSGLFIQGLGILLFSFPHLFNDIYLYNSDSFGGEEIFRCNLNEKDAHITEVCAKQNLLGSESPTHMKYTFMFAQFLNGLGATPLTVLAITYMDENVHPQFYPSCIAIYFLSVLLGPAIGFSVGGYSLTYFVDVGITPDDITVKDRVWVGRWWIGFLISGPILIALALPIFAFPKKLPDRVRRDLLGAEVSQPTESGGGRADCDSLSASLKSASRSMRSLALKASHWDLWKVVTNWSFMLLSLSAALLGSIVSGFLSFGPKYAESAFSKSSSEAALLYGIVCVPAASFGLISGAMMMSYPRTTPKGAFKVLLIVSFFTIFTHFGLLLDCGDSGFDGPAGRTDESSLVNRTETMEICVDGCHCSKHLYQPVCGRDNFTYFSPCYAGCHNRIQVPADQYSINVTLLGRTNNSSPANATLTTQYTNCSCIPNTGATGGSVNYTDAAGGRCGVGKKCKYQDIILTCIFFMISGMFFCIIPGIDLSLGIFPERLRSLALGVQWMMIRTIGTIPGPVIFGVLMDRSCMVWVNECPNDALSCVMYSNYLLSTNLFTIPIIHKILSVIPFFILVFIYKTDLRKKTSARMVSTHQQLIIAPGDGDFEFNANASETRYDSRQDD